MMTAKANLGRERNKVKFATWGFYLLGEGLEPQNSLKRLREVAGTSFTRVSGEPNQGLGLEKVSKNKVQLTWPAGVGADACAHILKKALGDNWRTFVTDPAGVEETYTEGLKNDRGLKQPRREMWKHRPPRACWMHSMWRCLVPPSAAQRLVQPRIRCRRGPRLLVTRGSERWARALQQPRPAVAIC